MYSVPVVYRKVVARIALLGLTRREVADQLGGSCGTLHNKLCDITPFTLKEAIQVKKMLGMTGTLEEIFERMEMK